MTEKSHCAWREGALFWINDDSARLPWAVPTNWRRADATEEARFLTILVFRATPDYLPPTNINVTYDGGVLIKWRTGWQELDIEVLPDATLEVLLWERAELVEEASFEPAALWRLCGFFAWLGFVE
jgi:hypothetical protein